MPASRLSECFSHQSGRWGLAINWHWKPFRSIRARAATADIPIGTAAVRRRFQSFCPSAPRVIVWSRAQPATKTLVKSNPIQMLRISLWATGEAGHRRLACNSPEYNDLESLGSLQGFCQTGREAGPQATPVVAPSRGSAKLGTRSVSRLKGSEESWSHTPTARRRGGAGRFEKKRA